MYSSMSLRIPILSFQKLYRKKGQFNSLILYFGSKYSSSSDVSQNMTTDKFKNIQYPKYIQPFVNQSVDEILGTVNLKHLNAAESVSILKALRMYTMFKNINSSSFTSDKRFEALCAIFEDKCYSMKPNLLVSGLRSLLEVGVPSTSTCVISAEQSIIRNIDTFSAFNIIGCLYFHHKFMETDLQKKVVTLLVKELCKRTSEISSSSDVLMLVHFLHIFDEDDRKNIEQKVIELIPSLNVHEICKILSTFAENSYRNTSILNALAFHLRQKLDVPDLKEILDILYSFKKLNFCDISLLSYLMNRAVIEIPSSTRPSVISGILTTSGYLRLKHIGVLDACGEWIVKHLELCRSKEFVSFILAVATLNHNTPETKKVLQTILPFLKFEKIESPDVWLDTVWSLAILDIVDKETLQKVLSPDFYKPLIDNPNFGTVTNKLKLMNLKAILKMYHPECVFGCELFLEPVEVPQSSDIERGRKHVIKVLNNFVPGEKYLCINLNTDKGVFIDAEFIMNQLMKPLPLSQYGILAKSADIKPLPKGSQRIALLTLFYKDFTLSKQSITGSNHLAVKILSAQGYTVVVVPFEEFIRYNTEVNKAKYLLQNITKSMKIAEEKL